MNVLVINAGSSSLKYQLLNVETHALLAKGICERVGSPDAFHKHGIDDNEVVIDAHMADHDEAMALVLETLTTGPTKAIDSLSEIDAVGHRIVQGGKYFDRSVIIDDEVIAKIDELAELAPLHNKAALMGIHACQKHMPGIPMVAVFDSAFFQSLPPKAYMYPLPYELYEKYGIRKYGAHGTSVRYVSGKAAELLGKDLKDLKLVVCHLGSGASVTAVKDGKCYDTSMGFSPLAGVTMGTRSGDVDPSVLQYIMKKEGITDFNEMIDILNRKSGLLGLSGISSDMRDIRNSDDKRARLAEAVFINRVVRYVGSYIAEMGGADAVVFTAGIGEHDDVVREGVMKSLSFMGVDFDDAANKAANEGFITKEDSKLAGLIIPTDEELMIERDVVRLAKLK